MGFAENLLGAKSLTMHGINLDYGGGCGVKFSLLLMESMNLYGKIAILVAGQASSPGATEPSTAPAHLDLAEAVFQGNAKVFVRDA